MRRTAVQSKSATKREEECRDAVHDRREDVLHGVEALEGVVEQHAHQGEVDDALGRREVAAVHAGKQKAAEEDGAAVGFRDGSGPGAAPLDGCGEARLENDEDQRERHEDGDDRFEGGLRKHEQQHRSGQPADRGGDTQSQDQ
ncbi:hypothetical protein SGRIM128S_00426 [Streptomyces griseomycini]